MDLNRLQDFIAVATHLHFGRAAEARDIDQSALSRSIRKLEISIGTSLFERSSRSVRLTEAGTALLEDARHLLRDADTARRRAQLFARGEGQPLRIGFVLPASFHLLPNAIRAFDEMYPHVEIKLSELTDNSGPEKVRQGELDLCLIVRLKNDDDHFEGLQWQPLLRQRLTAALPAGWPLARKRSIPLSALRGHPMVLFPRERATRLHQAILMACSSAGFQPNVVHEMWQMVTTLSFVANGMGASLLVQSAETLPIEGVKFLRVSDMPDYLEVDLLAVWNPQFARAPLRYLVESLQAAAPRIQAASGGIRSRS